MVLILTQRNRWYSASRFFCRQFSFTGSHRTCSLLGMVLVSHLSCFRPLATSIFFVVLTCKYFFLFGSVLRKPAVRSFLDLPPIETQFAPAQQPTFNLFGASKSVPAAGSSIAESDRSSSVLSQRFSDLENRAKSRRESQD